MTIGEAEPDADLGGGRPLEAGLHFIATPIGAARDITLRALDILRTADVLAAEDTRTLRHLMEIHGITLGSRPLVAYHDHNGEVARPRLLRALAEGRSVAYASEAGTPLVADPGFQLARAAIAEGHKVLAAPGPSAVLAALTVSGLPTDRFLFAGFPPATASARKKFLAELAAVPATLVFYESPRRVSRTLEDMALELGNREAAVCRELTKRFEEVSRGPVPDLAEAFRDRSVKGEIVIVVDRAPPVKAGAEELEVALSEALETMSVKEAAAAVAGRLGLARRDVYQAALRLTEER
ncbi:16S rRNA (cytidine(1402)-2'-O)-methyltransferase [Cereibacter azotoformans]|uniref:Ribosomal RNA small subunit methyltransferase I n=1 Tax=Cereibacter sphaeroides (strain ATCC 17025 / ATH 2.4.3) TaxID=349102 RepID=A4WPR3_CERS5|nr:16S rRNA (cytidine(1402)-2'-O)-methyltransferase [Cereibacter azotoformans]ULB08780.1 16S rRNA (cytidine(1402)-2'-O)-methyltransferase [Cereibacter azotoformans]